MAQEQIYKITYGVLFLVFMLIRIHYAKKSKGNVNIRTNGEKREKFLVFLVSTGMMIIPIIWIFSNVFQRTNIGLPSCVRIIGIITAILSLWLFYEVHNTTAKFLIDR